MNPFPRDRNVTRLQVLDPTPMTIPQTASLIVRGGALLQKGVIIGDTDTIVPGGIRFRDNHLQIREFGDWFDILGKQPGSGGSNEIVIFDDDGEALLGSGVDLINQQITGLESLEVKTIEPPGISGTTGVAFQLTTPNQMIVLPDDWGNNGEVLKSDGSGGLFWGSNLTVNELSYSGSTWAPNVLLQTRPGITDSMNTTDLTVIGTPNTTGLLTSQDYLSFQSGNSGVKIDNNIMPIDNGTPYEVMAIKPGETGVFRTYNLFGDLPTIPWTSSDEGYIMTAGKTAGTLLRNLNSELSSTGQLNLAKGILCGDIECDIIDSDLITGVTINSTNFYSGDIVIANNGITGVNKIYATSFEEPGGLIIEGGEITGVNTLNVSGSVISGNISTSGNITSNSTIEAIHISGTTNISTPLLNTDDIMSSRGHITTLSISNLYPSAYAAGSSGIYFIQSDATTNKSIWYNFRRGGGSLPGKSGIIYSSFSTSHFFVNNNEGVLSWRYSTENTDEPDHNNSSEYMRLEPDGDFHIYDGDIYCNQSLITDTINSFGGETILINNLIIENDGSTYINLYSNIDNRSVRIMSSNGNFGVGMDVILEASNSVATSGEIAGGDIKLISGDGGTALNDGRNGHILLSIGSPPDELGSEGLGEVVLQSRGDFGAVHLISDQQSNTYQKDGFTCINGLYLNVETGIIDENSSDVAGYVSNIDFNTFVGNEVSLYFAKPYDKAPFVVITPNNNFLLSVSNVTTTHFTIYNHSLQTHIGFYYHVIGGSSYNLNN